MSSFTPVLCVRIVLDSFYLLIFYSEKLSTWIWRWLFGLNVNLNRCVNYDHVWMAYALSIHIWRYRSKYLPQSLSGFISNQLHLTTTTSITTNYTYPIARSSECPFALVVQINAENTAIVSHQRKERFTLTNVPDFTLKEMMNEIKSCVDLIIPTKVSQQWKTFDKTFTPCLRLTVYIRSQKLRSNAKMQNMGKEVSAC